jgi:hypothetical protein
MAITTTLQQTQPWDVTWVIAARCTNIPIDVSCLWESFSVTVSRHTI